MTLNALRDAIDSIDDDILILFERRMELAEKVAEYKLEHSIGVASDLREQEILRRLLSKTTENTREYVKSLYEKIFELSKEFQRKYIDERVNKE